MFTSDYSTHSCNAYNTRIHVGSMEFRKTKLYGSIPYELKKMLVQHITLNT